MSKIPLLKGFLAEKVPKLAFIIGILFLQPHMYRFSKINIILCFLT